MLVDYRNCKAWSLNWKKRRQGLQEDQGPTLHCSAIEEEIISRSLMVKYRASTYSQFSLAHNNPCLATYIWRSYVVFALAASCKKTGELVPPAKAREPQTSFATSTLVTPTPGPPSVLKRIWRHQLWRKPMLSVLRPLHVRLQQCSLVITPFKCILEISNFSAT